MVVADSSRYRRHCRRHPRFMGGTSMESPHRHCDRHIRPAHLEDIYCPWLWEDVDIEHRLVIEEGDLGLIPLHVTLSYPHAVSCRSRRSEVGFQHSGDFTFGRVQAEPLGWAIFDLIFFSSLSFLIQAAPVRSSSLRRWLLSSRRRRRRLRPRHLLLGLAPSNHFLAPSGSIPCLLRSTRPIMTRLSFVVQP